MIESVKPTGNMEIAVNIEREKKPEPKQFFSGNSLNKEADDGRIPAEAKGVQKTIPYFRSPKMRAVGGAFADELNNTTNTGKVINKGMIKKPKR